MGKRIATLQLYAGGRIVEHADPAVILAQPEHIVADAAGPWGAHPSANPSDSRKPGPWG